MTSPLAKMLSQAVTGQRSQIVGPKGAVRGAGMPQPSREPMSMGFKKSPLPGKSGPKGPVSGGNKAPPSAKKERS